MKRRHMTWLGIAVCLANLAALCASIIAGMYGLLAANLVGLGAGVWCVAGLPGIPHPDDGPADA